MSPGLKLDFTITFIEFKHYVSYSVTIKHYI